MKKRLLEKILNLFSIILILVFTSGIISGCGAKNRKTYVSEDAVAYLSIVAFDGAKESKYGLMNLGHAFVVVENITNDTMTIGNYELLPGKIVTIATWSIAEHYGVWYNVESNYSKYFDKYNGRVSVLRTLNSTEVESISKYIRSNDYWSIYKNCTYFTLHLWNMVATDDERLTVPLIYSTSHLVREIETFDKVDNNIEIITPDGMLYYRDGEFHTFYLEGSDVDENI